MKLGILFSFLLPGTIVESEPYVIPLLSGRGAGAPRRAGAPRAENAARETRLRLSSRRSLMETIEKRSPTIALWVNYVGFFLHTARGRAHRRRRVGDRSKEKR